MTAPKTSPPESTPAMAGKAKTARPRRTRSPDRDDISAREAAAILPRSYPTQFNLERERRQLVLDPITGLCPYPLEFLQPGLDEDACKAKAHFDQTHYLVVIEWGGTKPPGRAWSYSRRQCKAVAYGGLLAELRARREWGLPTVSDALGGRVRAPRRPRNASHSDQESASQG